MNARVLIVDDDPDLRSLLDAELRARGYEAAVVASGEAAVARVQETEFDVVVSDVVMSPQISGLDVLRTVKEASPGTEVVIMTGHASLETAVACLRAGAFDFVQKPFPLDQLINTVARAVERTRLHATTALYQASQRIVSEQEGGTLPERIAQVAMDVLGADLIALLLPEPGGALRPHHVSPEDPALAADLARLADARVVGRVVRDRALLLLPQDEGRGDGDLPRLEQLGSAILCPLVARTSLVGALILGRSTGRRRFRKADLECAAVLAAQATLAIRNETLVKHLVASERLAAMGQIAASIAHEINNPLTSVLGNLEELREILGRLPYPAPEGDTALAQVAELLVDIDGGTRQIRDVAQDLRGLSQGSDHLRARFDLDEVIRSAVRLASPYLRKRIQLSLRLGEVPEVVGSPGRMCQVFLNLLINAAQAMEEAGRRGEVLITTERRGDQVVAQVSDDGPGIASEHLDRIMEPLFTTKPPGKGAGLGLSISREIVHRHGGSLEVRSTPGGETTFTLTLPLAPGA